MSDRATGGLPKPRAQVEDHRKAKRVLVTGGAGCLMVIHLADEDGRIGGNLVHPAEIFCNDLMAGAQPRHNIV